MKHDVTTNYDLLRETANRDVDALIEKDKEYGGSWYRRGGVGAYMMLFRKIDRIETQCEKVLPGLDKYDIIERAVADGREEGLLDDIGDLRRYLFLVEEKIRSLMEKREVAYVVSSAVRAKNADSSVSAKEAADSAFTLSSGWQDNVLENSSPKAMTTVRPDNSVSELIQFTDGVHSTQSEYQRRVAHPAPFGFDPDKEETV